MAKYVFFNIKTHGTGNCVGHYQRWRGQESLLGIGMDTAIKVTVTGKHRCCIEVAVDDFLLNAWIQRATHTVTGSTGKGYYTKAKLFQFW